jgi:VWFA-related protein
MMTAWFNGDAMAQLARETGGQFFENSNNLLKGIRTAFADGREEYVLAYVPANTNMDGQFRKIAVELKDKKLRVAAKAGYWSVP